MKALILFIIVFILYSCQDLKYGNVIAMEHEPDNTFFMIMPLTISTGKSTSIMMIPYWIHDSEDWVVKVRGIGTKGDTITRTLYVDKASYDTLSIGKFICIDGMCDEDENNTKERQ